MFSKKILSLAIIILLSAYPILLQAQELIFSTNPSANKVGIKDKFRVSFTLKNANKITDFEAPSFSGFKVLDGPIQSKSTNLSFVNGHRQSSSSVRLTYILKPQKTGTLKIDGAIAKVDGHQLSSNSVTIHVVRGSVAQERAKGRPSGFDPFGNDPMFQAMQKQQQRITKMMQQQMRQMQRGANANRRRLPRHHRDLSGLDEKNLKNNVFIKVTVNNTHPYVGQQITASYKLYTRLPMNMSLTKLPDLNGFWSEDFDIPNPPKPKMEIINGKKYQVFLLKKSALFPQHAGKLTLDPAKAKGTVRIIEKTKDKSPLAKDPSFGSLFMQDPYFNNGFFSKYQYKDVSANLSSKPVSINVKPLPVTNQPDSFTGAVGHFKVSATVDTSSLSAGNYANFILTIKGSGNFKLISNPKIDFPPSLRALDPMVSDSIISRSPSIKGEKTFTYNLSPAESGKFTIPSIAFAYFDPTEKRYKVLHTKPITINVPHGEVAVNNKNNNTSMLPEDIHPNITKKQNWTAVSLFLVVDSPWYWGIYVLALLLFVIGWYLHRREKHIAAHAALWRNKKANKVAWRRLTTARKILPKKEEHTAFYEEISRAIWLYMSDKLNIPLSDLSKENIADNLNSGGVDEAQIKKVHELLSECELNLYSPSGGTQKRESILKSATELIGALEKVLRKKKKLNLNGVS